MNIPDHISESLETVFGLKYLNALVQMRSASGIRESFLPWIRDGKKSEPGSDINIPDPQHWEAHALLKSRDLPTACLEKHQLYLVCSLAFGIPDAVLFNQ
jgi:hypothetical protein